MILFRFLSFHWNIRRAMWCSCSYSGGIPRSSCTKSCYRWWHQRWQRSTGNYQKSSRRVRYRFERSRVTSCSHENSSFIPRPQGTQNWCLNWKIQSCWNIKNHVLSIILWWCVLPSTLYCERHSHFEFCNKSNNRIRNDKNNLKKNTFLKCRTTICTSLLYVVFDLFSFLKTYLMSSIFVSIKNLTGFSTERELTYTRWQKQKNIFNTVQLHIESSTSRAFDVAHSSKFPFFISYNQILKSNYCTSYYAIT